MAAAAKATGARPNHLLVGVMAEQAVMTTRRFMVNGHLFTSRVFNVFNITHYVVDRPDAHGLFFFLAG